MRKKIETEEDVKTLVTAFYNKVLANEMLSPFFAHAVSHHWDKHLEVIERFWNNVIFFTGGYTGNPLQIHTALNHFMPLKAENFKQWLSLFTQTVDELYEGEKAELAKQRAISIATVMQVKIFHKRNDDNIY